MAHLLQRFCSTSGHRRRLGALVVAMLLAAAARADIVQPRTTAREIQLLNPSEAAEAEPVHLKGVVTVAGAWKNSFFLRDATAGIAINRVPGGPELHAGDRVTVDGVTAPGDFAPVVNQAIVRVTGHGAMPPAPHMRASDLDWGVQDSQWVEVEGEVRSVERRSAWDRPRIDLTLNLGAGEPTPVRVVSPDPDFAWNSLTGATVRLRAVAATTWNEHRQFTGVRLFITSRADLTITRPAPANAFDVPFRQVGGLIQFSRATGEAGQVEIQGAVSLVEPKLGFFVQDQTGAVYVSYKQQAPAVGELVEVVGFPTVKGGNPVLQASRFRTIGFSQVPVKPLANAEQVITRRADFQTTPYSGELVEITARVIDLTPGLRDEALLLKSGDVLFRARVPIKNGIGPWQIGSVLRLRGVCDILMDDNNLPEGFLLRLRSDADVTVVQRATWWTTAHALWLSGALGVLTLGMLGWVTLLRRQANLRTLIATDPLTGLYNRRAFLLLAEKQIETMRRSGSALLLFYLDVDRFKSINDTHGHRAGDEALKDVAHSLRQVFRESDIVCRMGGDEFAVLAADSNAGTEANLRVRIAEAVLEQNHRNQRAFRIALSIGVVSYDHTCAERSIEDILEHADALMYGNKRQRREAKLVPAAV